MKDRMDLRGFIFHDIDPVGAPEKKEIAKILDFFVSINRSCKLEQQKQFRDGNFSVRMDLFG